MLSANGHLLCCGPPNLNVNAAGHSFAELCVPHRSELSNFARRLTANFDLGQDIVQDTYVNALLAWDDWTGMEGMEPIQAARAWLYRIASNRFANHHRDTRLHRIVQTLCIPDIVHGLYGDVESIAVATSLKDPEQPKRMGPGDHDFRRARQMLLSRRDCDPTLLDMDISVEVLEAVARLHPKRREVVKRYYFEGEPCEAIAVALGIPGSSVRSLLMRARAKLAPLLERYARTNYELGGARVDSETESTERSESKPDRVKRVMRKAYRPSLRLVEMSPDQAATG